MVSKRLKRIFLITLFLIYVHGIEEILTGFSNVDSFMVFGAGVFNTSSELFYWVTHSILWVLLPILYVLINKKIFARILFSLFGIIFIVELHHIYKALEWKSYYPGLITSLMYPIIGIFYYTELIKDWRKIYGRN